MRRSFTLCSILVHAVVIAAALVAQVLAVGELPTPHRPLSFNVPRIILIDIHLPPPPRASTPTAPGAPRVSLNAAPIVSPSAVIPETTREGTPTASAGVPMTGEPGGLPPAIEGVGIAGAVPTAPPTPIVPVRLHAGIKPPKKIIDVAPVYPALARSAQVQGVVILEAVIDAHGTVASVRVLRSIPLLDQPAVAAVQQWHFTPALLNGDPVPVVMTVTVQFTLQDR